MTNSDDNDEKAKVPIVEQKGRFKVTTRSGIVDLDKVNGNFNMARPSFFKTKNKVFLSGGPIVSCTAKESAMKVCSLEVCTTITQICF